MESYLRHRVCLASLLVLFAVVQQGSGEVFSALTHFSTLIQAEERLVSELQSYIATEQERIAKLHTLAHQVKEAVESSNALGHEEHISHPTNAFLMVRRFTHDWKNLLTALRVKSSPEKAKPSGLAKVLEELSDKFPSRADVVGTAAALLRLQDTYKLNVSKLANGLAGSVGQRLSLADIFHLGVQAYNDELYKHAKKWFEQCLRRIYLGEVDEDIPESLPVDYLSYIEYKLGNLPRAIRWSKKYLETYPSDNRTIDNQAFYLGQLRKELHMEKNGTRDGAKEESEKERERRIAGDVWLSERGNYKELCRRPIAPPDHVAEKQICFYSNRNRTPGLILNPAKVEVAWVEPTVLLYRDMISDAEIERIKELATPKLKRATVHSPTTGKLEFADYRVSKSGWLSDEDDPKRFVSRINRRIEDYTGLTMSTAELLQVVNYGIGGQYEPHYDHARKEENAFESHKQGNRIATVLFYLSNVTAGGCTVFTKSNARIKPSKGDATFWYNLLPNGEGDERTRHAGCPVLSGSKWVCNKWIHEWGQEFLQPCKMAEAADWDIHIPPEHM